MERGICAFVLDHISHWTEGLAAIATAIRDEALELAENSDSFFEIIHLENGDLHKVLSTSTISSRSDKQSEPSDCSSSSSDLQNAGIGRMPVVRYHAGAQLFLEQMVQDLSKARTFVRPAWVGHGPPGVGLRCSRNEDGDGIDIPQLLRSIRRRKIKADVEGTGYTQIDKDLQSLQDRVAAVAISLLRGRGIANLEIVIDELDQLRDTMICEEACRNAKSFLNVT